MLGRIGEGRYIEVLGLPACGTIPGSPVTGMEGGCMAPPATAPACCAGLAGLLLAAEVKGFPDMRLSMLLLGENSPAKAEKSTCGVPEALTF